MKKTIFLIMPEELNEAARDKGIMSPIKDPSFNSGYAALETG